jgi:pimeloyl-ACP methyl ester carboxylesterase
MSQTTPQSPARTIDLPQGTIEYRAAGPAAADRPTVVFVHGFLVDGTLWSSTADALAAHGIRSLAPTWPLGSHRRAMAPEADLSPRGVARLVAAFLEALELEDVTLVGNDTGGAICQFLLDTDPSRVGRLVLTNCDAFENFPPAPFDKLMKAAAKPGVLRAALEPTRATAVRHSALGFGELVAHPLDPDQTRAWIEPALGDAAVRRDTRKLLSAIDPAQLLDVAGRLRRFGGPVLLAWAPQDRFFRIEFAHRLRDAFADARLVEIADAKTFVALDQPARLAEEIAAFQAATATGSSSAGMAPAGSAPETLNSRSAS